MRGWWLSKHRDRTPAHHLSFLSCQHTTATTTSSSSSSSRSPPPLSCIFPQVQAVCLLLSHLCTAAESPLLRSLWPMGRPDDDFLSLFTKPAVSVFETEPLTQKGEACCTGPAVQLCTHVLRKFGASSSSSSSSSGESGGGAGGGSTLCEALQQMLRSQAHAVPAIVELVVALYNAKQERRRGNNSNSKSEFSTCDDSSSSSSDSGGGGGGGGSNSDSSSNNTGHDLPSELLCEALGMLDLSSSKDTAASRNVSAFLEGLAETAPAFLLRNRAALLPLLGCKCYSVRNAVMTALGCMCSLSKPTVAAGCAGAGAAGAASTFSKSESGNSDFDDQSGGVGANALDRETRDVLLDLLLERAHDVTAYVVMNVFDGAVECCVWVGAVSVPAPLTIEACE